MAMFSKTNAFFFLISCMVVLAPHYCEAISCGQVSTAAAPCVKYLQSGGPIPLNCCTGIRALYFSATTVADRQAICRCVVTIAKSIPGINYASVNGLPGKCRFNVPYKLSPSLDCSKIN